MAGLADQHLLGFPAAKSRMSGATRSSTRMMSAACSARTARSVRSFRDRPAGAHAASRTRCRPGAPSSVVSAKKPSKSDRVGSVVRVNRGVA